MRKSCRPSDGDGLHGPTPCGPVPGRDDECACGCTAYEEACPGYLAWLARNEAFRQAWAGAAKDLAVWRRFSGFAVGFARRTDGELVRNLLKSREFYRKYI